MDRAGGARAASMVLLAAAAIAATGCGWFGVRVDPTSPNTTPSVVLTAAPSSGSAWGPLAVVPPQDGTDTARAEGTLRITEECVFLVWPDGRIDLLIWPADRTRWDANGRTISFANYDGSTTTVRDRTPVVLGGGGDNNHESGTTTEAWLARTQWVARPAASCPLDSRWWVGALTR